MSVLVTTAELPFRVAVEKLSAGGLRCSRPPDFSRPRIAIVGSRSADDPTCRFVFELAKKAALAGIDVVSGGATGVDASAHLGALDAGGPGLTWLVSPGNYGVAVPPEHEQLFDEVARRGIVVSQFATTDPTAATVKYLQRNRVITSLVDALVLCQAGIKSGSQHAARMAIEREVPVFVIASRPWDSAYIGSRRMAAQPGARWVHTETELWEAIQLATVGAGIPKPDQAVAFGAGKALLALLDQEPRHVDWLSQQSGLPMAELSPALLTLSLDEVIKEGPAGFWALGSRN